MYLLLLLGGAWQALILLLLLFRHVSFIRCFFNERGNGLHSRVVSESFVHSEPLGELDYLRRLLRKTPSGVGEENRFASAVIKKYLNIL